MTSRRLSRRISRGLGALLVAAGAVLLGWVGLTLLERERTDRRARSELQSAGGRVALVSRPLAWRAEDGGESSLDLPDEPPAVAEDSAPRGWSPRLIGRILAPEVGVDAMAFEGIDDATLELGAGHIPGTPLPGRRGNVSFAGHRNTDFRGLRDIDIGDAIYVETRASTYLYRVAETRIVEPEQVEVVAPRGRDELTLVTCHPFDWVGPAPRRFIVHADFVHEVPEGAPAESR